ncbi:isoprenylcysteine carboxyl methyltransferase family protein [Alteribacter aurantiacus]|uniref:isoprenylcysteine carboxyl methyltransferase family protein n=1 Tax=Alteribacter aurantiacus TaxID=254410 RepID=UPI000410A666|nr:isoprenylcysteine carboxylmethyltransferase family protein [Alteribacter aurantiacus]
MLFWTLIGIVIAQRGIELVVAKSNERYMLSQGAREFGQSHYKWIVMMHVGFFAFLTFEVFAFGKNAASFWVVPFALFLLAQGGRLWALSSLGRFWNTKIIVLPGADLVKRGPYRYLSHPNYVIVALEFIAIPLIFNAYATLIIFTSLNALLLLKVRIPEEEKALIWATTEE